MRPTVLQPFWNVAGFALGAVTAAIGPEAAMACTAAVETEIDKHYADQLDELGDSDPELCRRDRRISGRGTGASATPRWRTGAEQAFGYPVLSGLIRLGCKVAIALAKRI